MNTIANDLARSVVFSEGSRHLQRFNIVLTIRSIVLLLFVTYLFSGPITAETDIVATVLALAVICFIALLALITLVSSLRLRNKFEIHIYPPFSESDSQEGAQGIVSKKECRLVFKTTPLRVAPGFALHVKCSFASDALKPSVFHLFGSSNKERVIVQDVTFPHRGIWKLSEVALEFRDGLELTHYEWQLERELLEKAIRVSFPTEYDTSLPVICSSSRPGDLLPDLQQRQGDPFDLKQYHPSDGIKKILWKIFAKSGELISRHPEASMTPEGEVMVFVMADKDDDHVCSAALAYLRMLEQIDLRLFVSCEGSQGSKVAFSSEEAESMLIESVWNTAVASRTALRGELEGLLAHFEAVHSTTALQRVLVFCSKERLCTERGYECVMAVGHFLSERGIRPVFCIAQNVLDSRGLDTEYLQLPVASPFKGISDSLKKLTLRPAPEKPPLNRQIFSKFMISCSNNDWQVFV
ncbi:MAG: DUF58 domain-containing protein [Deltaproteobacteria bacterium]|nr:DUF58 domain-containing protein [Deltaproteobacteria bacterium]